VVAIDFATPSLVDRAGDIKFQDFLPCYVSGLLASQQRTADLYNIQVTSQLMREITPASAAFRLPILYGPQVAAFFEPFSKIPFAASALLWVTVSIVLYFVCCFVVWRSCPRLQSSPGTVIMLAIAFPPFFHTLVRGQNSALALCFFTAAFLALSSGKRYLAGLALGMLIFKPQLAIAAIVILLAAGEGKAILGFATSVAAQLPLAWTLAGTATMIAYINLLVHARTLLSSIEPSLTDAHCLRAFWDMLLPWPSISLALYLTIAAGVLALAALCWKSHGPLSLRFSSLLIATVLVSPHLYVYDLLILAPTFLLLSNWLLDHRTNTHSGSLGLLVYLAFLFSLVAPITKLTHVQLSVPTFIALQWVLYQISRKENTETVSELAPAHS